MTDTWEKEFDEIFTSPFEETRSWDDFNQRVTPEKVKDFIRSLLSSHTADMIAKMEGEKKVMPSDKQIAEKYLCHIGSPDFENAKTWYRTEIKEWNSAIDACIRLVKEES